MVGAVAAHVFQVVVLAGHAHALLRVDRARIRAFVGAQEDVFELDHPGVCKQQGGIPARDERSRGHSRVSMLDEEIDKVLADFRTGQFFRGHSCSEVQDGGYYTNDGHRRDQGVEFRPKNNKNS
jgi:hypothetical protein